jgi:hypothetical protein
MAKFSVSPAGREDHVQPMPLEPFPLDLREADAVAGEER